MTDIREGKMKLGGLKPDRNTPRPDVKPQGRRCYPSPVCPNCSLPRRALGWDGEVFKCVGCGSWWHRAFVLCRPLEFSINPGPPDGPEAA